MAVEKGGSSSRRARGRARSSLRPADRRGSAGGCAAWRKGRRVADRGGMAIRPLCLGWSLPLRGEPSASVAGGRSQFASVLGVRGVCAAYCVPTVESVGGVCGAPCGGDWELCGCGGTAAANERRKAKAAADQRSSQNGAGTARWALRRRSQSVLAAALAEPQSNQVGAATSPIHVGPARRGRQARERAEMEGYMEE